MGKKEVKNLKSKATFPSFERLRRILRRFYPLPEALVGYLFGILIAARSIESPAALYSPLPLKEALSDAISAELPFWFASALLVLIRPAVGSGRLLVFMKAACCGFGAELLLPWNYPAWDYFRCVCVSLMQIALYACPVRYAADRFGRGCQPPSALAVGDYWVRWLFYAGIAILLLPLKYFTGI